MNKIKLVFAALFVAFGLNSGVVSASADETPVKVLSYREAKAEYKKLQEEVKKAALNLQEKKDNFAKVNTDKNLSADELNSMTEAIKNAEDELKNAENAAKAYAKANYGWVAAAVCTLGAVAGNMTGAWVAKFMPENYAKVVSYTGGYVTRGGIARTAIVAAEVALIYAAYQAYVAYAEENEDEDYGDDD